MFLSIFILILGGCQNKATPQKQPKWDDSTIIYTSEETGNPEIFAINSNGSNRVNLSKSNGNDYSPGWSKKRDKIAFTSNRDGDSELFIINRNGSNLVKLTNNEAIDTTPAFSPNGKYITFGSDRDSLLSIYRMNSDGSNVVRLTYKYVYLSPAIFSPDGKFLVLKRKFDNPQRVEFFLADIYGKILRKMDPLRAGHEDPVFSKDSKKILFSAFDIKTKTWQIFIVDTETGKKLVRLTDDPSGYFAGASFSPDEKQVIFRKRERGTDDWSLWLMDSDGKNKKRITSKKIRSNIGIFSGNGKQILATITNANDDELKWHISVLSAADYKERRLTFHNKGDAWPQWFQAKNIP